jgi:hypothetical protein
MYSIQFFVKKGEKSHVELSDLLYTEGSQLHLEMHWTR